MRAGIRLRRRVPVPASPPDMPFLWASVLLALTFGMVLVALTDAYLMGRTGWAAFFAVAAAANLGVYLLNVRWWVAWTD